jgi:hypothetical protein
VFVMPAPRSTGRGSPDLPGAALLAAALLALLYPLVQGRELGWPLWTFGAIAGGVVLAAVFVAVERLVSPADLAFVADFARRRLSLGSRARA